MLNINKLKRSFTHAFRGLGVVFKEEQNFKIHSLAAILAIILALVLRVGYLEAAILVFAIVLVFCLEVINTIFENMIDVLKPSYHIMVGRIKDLMSASVLIASIGAIIVGIIIFLPHLV